jgi:subtilisin
MPPSERLLSRRGLLHAVAGVTAAGGLPRRASAHDEGHGHLTVNVGYHDQAGRALARAEANWVLREFGFDALTVSLPFRAVRALRESNAVRYVEHNAPMQAFGEAVPWGIERVAADVAHEKGKFGDGADVAIIDTGIDPTHPDLRDSLGVGAAAVACSSDCAVAWDDDNGHGTHCAGIANARMNEEGVVGVSPAATLHAVKVLDDSGTGSVSDVAAGIEWVADRGFDVANLSLGGSEPTDVVKDAVEYARDQGVMLVAAAGNAGSCSDCVGYPAAYDEVVAVSATDDADQLASFSSTGPQVELAAPGKAIRSTVPGGYASLSGTSMATPHVAGAAAQLTASGYDADEARSRLRETAADLGLSETAQGAGLLDVRTALGLADAEPVVTTGEPYVESATEASFLADLSDLGGADAVDVRFAYGESDAETLSQRTDAVVKRQPDTASVRVEGLSPATTYAVRAEAAATDGDTATGQPVSFTTPEESTAPQVRKYIVSGMGDGQGSGTISAAWGVIDDDGDLETVTVTVLTMTGDTVGSAATDCSGDSAAGAEEFTVPAGERYDVRLRVIDQADNSDSMTFSIGV